MNGYSRLSDIQAQLAGVGTTDLVDKLVSFRDEASREFDAETGRWFYTLQGTRYYNGDGRDLFLLGDDVISVTSIAVAETQEEADAGTYDYTLVEGTDYVWWPRNAAQDGKPYRGIQLLPSGTQISVFTKGLATVKIVGAFGYSEEWEDSGLTATVTSTTGLTLTANDSAANIIDAGDVLKLDSEQVGAVASVATTSVVIEAGGRGRNGTTAANHNSAATLYIRRYPRDIERVVKERAVGLAWDSQGGYRAASVMAGEGTDRRASYARWRQAVDRYTNPATVL